MNSLSWLVYFGGVAQNLAITLSICGGVVVAGVAVASIMTSVDNDKPTLAGRRWLVGAFVAFGVASFMPSQNTVYAIAASELGQRAISNKEVGRVADKASRALEAWLDKQLSPSTESKSK